MAGQPGQHEATSADGDFVSRGLTLGLLANNVGCHLWFHVSVDHGDDAVLQVLCPAWLFDG